MIISWISNKAFLSVALNGSLISESEYVEPSVVEENEAPSSVIKSSRIVIHEAEAERFVKKKL